MSVYPKAQAPATEAALKAANDRADRWQKRYTASREAVVALLDALDRTESSFRLAVNGRPVRDMTETLAENAYARKVALSEEQA